MDAAAKELRFCFGGEVFSAPGRREMTDFDFADGKCTYDPRYSTQVLISYFRVKPGNYLCVTITQLCVYCTVTCTYVFGRQIETLYVSVF